MIIAIDGPAASGKGTLGKRLARHYGYRHLDTGVIYRAVAKALLDAGADLTDVMIFVVADPKVRARRRTLEARARGEEADEVLVLADILKRDERDQNRATAPLKAAPDAHLLDNTHLDIEGGVRAAIDIVEAVRAGRQRV